MDQLQLPHAKLLYFVSELWKSQQINDSEKTIIKGFFNAYHINLIINFNIRNDY